MIGDTNWYVIHVSTGCEHKLRDMIVKQLEQTNIPYEDCFVPTIEFVQKVNQKYVTKEKPMFPGYLFLICTPEQIGEVATSLKQVMGFTKILGESQTFIPLYPQEVEFLLGFSDDNHNVGLSCGFIENDKITVTQGPLLGKEGLIKKINRHKRIAEVELLFMGRTTKVQVPLEIITKQ